MKSQQCCLLRWDFNEFSTISLNYIPFYSLSIPFLLNTSAINVSKISITFDVNKHLFLNQSFYHRWRVPGQFYEFSKKNLYRIIDWVRLRKKAEKSIHLLNTIKGVGFHWENSVDWPIIERQSKKTSFLTHISFFLKKTVIDNFWNKWEHFQRTFR